MARRSSSSYFASLLVALQLLIAPFAHAVVNPSGDEGCAGMALEDAMSMGAGDCAHTPALETVRVLLLEPTPPVAVEFVPVTPAFDTPLFRLLRPPK